MCLLERDRQGVLLTPAGQVFLGRARTLLADADFASAEARATERGEVGRLRLGRSLIAFIDAVDVALVALRARYPLIEVEISELPTHSQELALTESQLDVGVLHPPLSRPGIRTAHLGEEPLQLAIPSGHDLSREPGAVLDVRSLDGQVLIFYPRWQGPSLHDRITAYLQAAGARPLFTRATAPLTGAVQLVARGDGCALVTSMIASRPAAGVIFRPLPDDAPRLPVAAAWREGARTPLAEAFVNQLTRVRGRSA
ncbi:DNA-binding transcriptional LysR family regulator [Catenuloplanes nepalensis]|uniref:DNA-binding transcriptional LysR family regulator n=1 Tax=Catenuloplanes nepalensis TaxID=587533 RepID=A0ABT9MNP6_9ACTN|nr:DNA-binding transcriptional LysR family regulator [Catenuloplanes nepalensis]